MRVQKFCEKQAKASRMALMIKIVNYINRASVDFVFTVLLYSVVDSHST